MLFSTSLVALILSPRRLLIKNTKVSQASRFQLGPTDRGPAKRDLTMCELTFPTTVLAIRLNRKRLVIVLEDQIYLYDFQNMKLLYTIETSPNPYAICALSPSSDNCYLAYPLPQKAATNSPQPAHIPPNSTHVPTTTGELQLFDTLKLKAVNVIEAHKSPLSCMIFNKEGNMIATASDKGTIIRIFSVPDGQKLYQFRRGSMPSRIFSMAFNTTSTMLCVSSASETIHIFKLGPQSQPQISPPASPGRPVSHHRTESYGSDFLPDVADGEEEDPSSSLAARKPNGTFMGLIRRTSQNVGSSLANTVGTYLPKGVAEMWEPARDFAWIRLPKSGTASSSPLRSVVAMSSDAPQVMVVTNEGNFFVFGIDLAKGGEGTLLKQYSVLDIHDKMAASGGEF